MKSASHHAMGYLLYSALEQEGIQLDKELFVLGNLLPDYLPELILAPHFTMKCQREINLFTGVLAAQRVLPESEIPLEYSLRLGILCHYLTDYFCFAHSREFQQNLARHSSYEQALDDYFRDHYSVEECLLPAGAHLQAKNAREAVQEIFRLKHEYKSAERCFQTDVQYAFSVCLGSIRTLLSLSAAAQKPVRAALLFSPFTAERYAFQSGVRHKAIVPRRAWCMSLIA
ncbi:MAG: zinc dependent phospholipase C family protein [Clostridiaceae bacterium]|nr:zinc dependent phospholipase C family protein [Feifaniaceae bacterium]